MKAALLLLVVAAVLGLAAASDSTKKAQCEKGRLSSNGLVCCAAECDYCGGLQCLTDPSEKCCSMPILAAGKQCTEDGIVMAAAPCVVNSAYPSSISDNSAWQFSSSDSYFMPSDSSYEMLDCGEGASDDVIQHPNWGCVKRTQICPEPHTDVVCNRSNQQCTGVTNFQNGLWYDPVCETHCGEGKVLLGPETQPWTSEETCIDAKKICPNKSNVCTGRMYSECGSDNKCMCKEGTVAAPLEGHADAFGNPVCVDAKLQCEDGSVCPGNYGSCSKNQCQCADNFTKVGEQCIESQQVCENGTVCSETGFCYNNACGCPEGQVAVKDAPFTTCRDRAQVCLDSKGAVTKSCAGIEGTTCINDQCVCNKKGTVLSSERVLLGGSETPVKATQQCIPARAVCNTGDYSEVNRVCMHADYWSTSSDAFSSSSIMYSDAGDSVAHSAVTQASGEPAAAPEAAEVHIFAFEVEGLNYGWRSGSTSKFAVPSCVQGSCKCPEGQIPAPHRHSSYRGGDAPFFIESCQEACGERNGMAVVCARGTVCSSNGSGSKQCIMKPHTPMQDFDRDFFMQDEADAMDAAGQSSKHRTAEDIKYCEPNVAYGLVIAYDGTTDYVCQGQEAQTASYAAMAAELELQQAMLQ